MKKSLTLMAICSVFALTACSKGPSDSQMKDAVAKFHASGDSEAEKQIRSMIDKEIKLESCVEKDEGFNCKISNVKTGAADDQFFYKDPDSGKWVYDIRL